MYQKKKEKMPLFPKNIMHFEFFTNEMECERGKQDFSNRGILLNATSAFILVFQHKMPGKRVSKNIIQLVYFNYYKDKSVKEITDLFQQGSWWNQDF